jgi:alginate O-acetyltransferase complex protein AlgI
MVFTSLDYIVFLFGAFAVYWALPTKTFRNGLLLLLSYVFYGYVHPWFCLLIAGATLVNYLVTLGMIRFPDHRKALLAAGLAATLAQLGFFKYFGFFKENILLIAQALGVYLDATETDIFLPVGISFFTFQAIGYTIDVYRGGITPRRNLVDFALFVSFFPQLVSGPIERSTQLLPQFEEKRQWQWNRFASAWPLLIFGYLKKLVIADNVSVFANKVFALQHPSMLLLFAGSVAFALQIYADFSAYTDIARGSGRLLGFELTRNFDSPYLSVSPSDFWRRWHISFSTWIRDYLYIPLGGSRVGSATRKGVVLLLTFALSGLWHGPAWHFVFWGIYHAGLLLVYRAAGFEARWTPRTALGTVAARAVMFLAVTFGWTLFRAPDLEWVYDALFEVPVPGLSGDSLTVTLVILSWTALYATPFVLLRYFDEGRRSPSLVRAVLLGFFLMLIAVFSPESQQDFIYFQF